MYRIELTSRAAKQLRNIERKVQVRLAKRIESLARNPRPSGVEKLEGEDGFYRIRIGDYRVLYQIHDDKLLVLVVKLGDRKEIYR